MYGRYVHEAVLAAGEQQSGITIHKVNEAYDEGGTILQACCPVKPGDTPAALATRIHQLEHFFFPVRSSSCFRSFDLWQAAPYNHYREERCNIFIIITLLSHLI